MGSLPCSADLVVSYLFRAFSLLLVVRAVLSWIPSLNGAWSTIIFRLTDPVIEPVNRVIPPVGGFSLAYIVVFFLTGFLANYFGHQAVICQYGLPG